MMLLQEFRTDWDRLVKWCGKNPDKTYEQADVFFGRIKYIPTEAWPWIVDSYLDAHEPGAKLPTPSWVKEAYQSWLEHHPYKKAPPEPEKWCPQCKGKGFLDLLKETEPTFTESLCRCGHCDNWRRTMGISIPRWTRWEAAEQGWVILTQPAEPGDEVVIDARKLMLMPSKARSYEMGPISEPIDKIMKEDDIPF